MQSTIRLDVRLILASHVCLLHSHRMDVHAVAPGSRRLHTLARTQQRREPHPDKAAAGVGRHVVRRLQLLEGGPRLTARSICAAHDAV